MATLAELHRGVRAALASKRLGQPVFVRYHAQGILDAEGAVLPALARLAVEVGDWMGEPPARLYQLQGRKGHFSILLQFARGGTALLSTSDGVKGGPAGPLLMVLGNKGALYHDLASADWDEVPASLTEPRRAAEVLAAIEDTREKGTNPVDVRRPDKAPPSPPPKEKPAPAKRYGVLLVTGSHTHQENYAAAFAADPRAKLIALTDEKDVDARRRRLNERLARELGVDHEPDLAKALARPDVDLVCVCAEPERRGRIAVLCAQAGKHLYLDKSLAPGLDEADAIAAAVKKAGVKSHMYSFVSQPWAAQARQVLQSGKLGKLLAIHADALFAKGRQGTARLGSPRKEEYPPRRHQLVEAKREFDNVGVYPITLATWLTGKKFARVYAVTGNYFFAEHQKHDVEDFGALAGALADGTVVSIAAGRCGWTAHPAGGVNRLLLVGTERSVVIDANRPRLEVSTDEPPWTPPNVNPDDPMGFWMSTQAAVHLRPKQAWLPFGPAKTDAAYFLDRLEAGKDSELSAVEAAHAAEVLLAAYLSASKGEEVKLPLPR